MKQSSLYTIMSLTGDMISVYPELRQIIDNANTASNPEKYIAFMSAGRRGRWFSNNYLSRRKFNGLKNALLSFKSGKECGSLVVNIIKSTAQLMEITGNKNFISLENMLPDFLIALSREYPEHSDTLTSLSKRMTYEITLTEEYLKKWKNENKADSDFNERIEKRKIMGVQNAAVDEIISNLLSTLDKKVAHDIRVKIARSDNKLFTLNQLMTAQ